MIVRLLAIKLCGFLICFLIAISCLASDNHKFGFPQETNVFVNRGIKDFFVRLKVNGLDSLPSNIEACWERFRTRVDLRLIAQCFALDYGSSTAAELRSKSERISIPEVLRIEATLGRTNRALKKLKFDQDDRGEFIAGWITAANAMLKFFAERGGDISSPETPGENRTIHERAKAAVMKATNAQVKSFEKLERVLTPSGTGEIMDVVCGSVDLLNASTPTMRRFVYFLKDETTYIDSGIKNWEDLDYEVVTTFCAEE